MSFTRHDLEGTVLPLVTIDAFAAKSGLDEEVVVVAFYVIDQMPANDLNTFIQRGNSHLLDVEVSPNPDVEGRYLVFVEFLRNDTFEREFRALLKDVVNVAGDIAWEVKPFAANHTMALDDPDLFGFVITAIDDQEEKEDLDQVAIKEFLSTSLIDTLTENKSNVIFNNRIIAKIVSIGYTTTDITRKQFDFLDESAEIKLLSTYFGNNYTLYEASTNTYSNIVVVDNNINQDVMILKDVAFNIG